jgi:LysR family hydrogen peroxide-inducible transcriptional activator
MVAGGAGVTLLPALATATVRRAHPDVALVAFRSPPPGRTLGLAWRRSSHRGEEFALFGQAVEAALAAPPA